MFYLTIPNTGKLPPARAGMLYSLDSRHVQHSLNMWWNNGKKDGTFHVRVFKQVSDLDVDADDFDVEEAFVEIKYKRGRNGVWIEK